MVTRLERQEMVRRQTSPRDRRAVLVSLTPRGDGLRDDVSRIWSKLETITMAGLTAAERDEVLRVLRRVTQGIPVPER